MKRLNGFVVLALFGVIVGTGFAHPPASVEAEFGITDHVLKILVKHSSRDQGAHFIDGITVVLNGKTVVEQTFFSQMDNGKQEVSYILHGDLIRACRRFRSGLELRSRCAKVSHAQPLRLSVGDENHWAAQYKCACQPDSAITQLVSHCR